jgi:hypothetical protein
MHQTLLMDKEKFADKMIKTEEVIVDNKRISQIIDDSKYKEELMSILEELDDIEQEY